MSANTFILKDYLKKLKVLTKNMQESLNIQKNVDEKLQEEISKQRKIEEAKLKIEQAKQKEEEIKRRQELAKKRMEDLKLALEERMRLDALDYKEWTVIENLMPQDSSQNNTMLLVWNRMQVAAGAASASAAHLLHSASATAGAALNNGAILAAELFQNK